MMVNNGPFVGKDGKHVTMNKIRDRLVQEKKANISLKIEETSDEKTRPGMRKRRAPPGRPH